MNMASVGLCWLVVDVLVDRKHRAKGLGHRLLRRCVDECNATKCCDIYVVPGGYDTPLKRLRAWYVRQGFVPVTETLYVYNRNKKII